MVNNNNITNITLKQSKNVKTRTKSKEQPDKLILGSIIGASVERT